MTLNDIIKNLVPLYPDEKTAEKALRRKLRAIARSQHKTVAEYFHEVEHKAIWSDEDRRLHDLYCTWSAIYRRIMV